MTAAYEVERERRWQPLTDVQVAVMAASLVLGVVAHERVDLAGACVVAGALAVVARLAGGRPRLTVLVAVAIVLVGVGAVRGMQAWDDVEPDRLGAFSGWATLVDDPQPIGRALRVVLEVDGERFQVHAYGSPRRRLARALGGERVEIVAERVPLGGRHPRRAQVRHVVGELRVERVGAVVVGSPLASAANRVRVRLQETASATMPATDAALFTGLVIGDDRRQDPATIDRFRAAGLSHLTAVSGQNVAFVLAFAGLALRSLRPWARWAATLAVIGWFVTTTRFEPSIVRAGTMAALSATAFALGRDRAPARLLALAVGALVVVDPLLVWSVGFWLSVGATVGVTVVAPAIEQRLHGPRWVVAPVAVTVGAQVGVLLPAGLVFGSLPALSVPANLLAVPVAGFVMLYGLPAGLLAGALPAPLASVVMLPARIGTRWVATVAVVADALTPTGPAAVATWAAQAAGLVGLWRLGRRRRSAPGT